MSLPRRIVVPTDFSDTAEAAFAHAIELAAALGAQVLLLHVFQPPGLDLTEGLVTGLGDATDRLLASARKALASAAEGAKGRSDRSVSVETEIAQGVPWRVIVEKAGDADDTLVVIGTHGRSGAAHALIGSVAEKVVRMARCPVLTVSKRVAA